MSTEIFQRAPLLLQLAPNVCLPAKRRVKCETGALQYFSFTFQELHENELVFLRLVYQSIRVNFVIPSSFCDRSFIQEFAFPRFAEGFSQMLFDSMHEGHEKRDGDRYELKPMSQSEYCFRSTYCNGNRSNHPLSYSSDKHISSPALSIFTLARRAIDLFLSGLSYHSRIQNNPPTKFDCLFQISSFIELYHLYLVKFLDNLTKPFLPCCFKRIFCFKNFVLISDRLASNADVIRKCLTHNTEDRTGTGGDNRQQDEERASRRTASRGRSMTTSREFARDYRTPVVDVCPSLVSYLSVA
ncbi:hypothetical protein ALC53_06492 [Atta colombica]|uniref:Uncharacterized protein n=1 Tax=Atta colombica TaxID=520822 RepID=A0A195BG90_9HYME|nr:hypothetical protein ALC53_06492 [Atta colombica]